MSLDPTMPVTPQPPANIASLSGVVANPSQPPPWAGQPSADQTVQNSLSYFMNPNSQLMQQAQQQGLDMAAERGGLNSSIAAGNAERAAMGSVMPLVNQSLGIQQQQQQMQGQDWLNSQGFNRQLQGAMTMLPITSAYHMMDTVQQYALQDPALYTPDVISGYTQFFKDNMNNVMDGMFNNSGSTSDAASTGTGG